MTDLSTIPLLPTQDEEHARQLQRELDAVSYEPYRGGEVTVPLHPEPVIQRVSDYGILVLSVIETCVTPHSDQ